LKLKQENKQLKSNDTKLNPKNTILNDENTNLLNENQQLKNENENEKLKEQIKTKVPISLSNEINKLPSSVSTHEVKISLQSLTNVSQYQLNTSSQSTQNQSTQSSSKIQTIIEKREQTNSGIGFHFPDEQRNQISQWKSIKIVYQNFPIENNQLSILKSETNTILIHPKVFSFVNLGMKGCFEIFKMESIEIPNSITSLLYHCFYKCSSLTQISLPDSITSLGNSCFRECSSFSQILLPNSIKNIGECCFMNCVNLTKINQLTLLIKIGNYFFDSCEKLLNKPF
jgi:hypothetical protein